MNMASSNIKILRLLSSEKFEEFLSSFDVILCDCDGVIWTGSGPTIPRAGEAMQMLKDRCKQVKFVSNNSWRSNSEYLEKFKQIGLDNVEDDDIIHPAKTMSWYLNNIKPHSRVFSLMPRTASQYLSEHGIDIVPMDIDFNTADARDFTKFMLRSEPSKVEAVVVDLNVNTGFAHLIKALQYLKDPECQLILGAMDAFIPLTQQFIIPGFVDFYQFLIKHSKKEPVILAKPSKILADILKDRFAITDPKRCLFIGDSLKLDIAFGKSVGFQTLFVSSGVDTEEDMLNAPNESTPDYYTESVADIIDILCK